MNIRWGSLPITEIVGDKKKRKVINISMAAFQKKYKDVVYARSGESKNVWFLIRATCGKNDFALSRFAASQTLSRIFATTASKARLSQQKFYNSWGWCSGPAWPSTSYSFTSCVSSSKKRRSRWGATLSIWLHHDSEVFHWVSLCMFCSCSQQEHWKAFLNNW